MCAAAAHLGLARRALDEARRELRGKTDRFTQKLILEEQAVLRSLEEAEGLLYVCKAGVTAALDAIWDCGQRGQPASTELRSNDRLACVTKASRLVTDTRSSFLLDGLDVRVSEDRALIAQLLHSFLGAPADLFSDNFVSGNLSRFDGFIKVGPGLRIQDAAGIRE